MNPKKLMEMMGDKPKVKMSESKDQAVKEVLTALKQFAEEMMAGDLKGKAGEEPELVGMKVKMATAIPEGEEELPAEGEMPAEIDDEEADLPGEGEEMEDLPVGFEDEDEGDLDKLKMLMKSRKE